MSDAADAQGDFTIERVTEAGDDRKSEESRSARHSEKRDPVLEAVNDAPPPETSATTAEHDDGFPDRVRRKYYVVADQQAKERVALKARVYADERGEYLAFKATEDRLTTRLASAQVVHDMIAVAEHRNWRGIHLRGSAEFRREAWLEASARGMDVAGYEPTDIDRGALASRRETRERANRRPAGIVEPFEVEQSEARRSIRDAPERRRPNPEQRHSDRRLTWQAERRSAAGCAGPLAIAGGKIPRRRS